MSKRTTGLLDSFSKDQSRALDQIRHRVAGNRPRRRYYLIVCEGEKTEPNYFNALRSCLSGGEGDRIVVVGGCDNTLQLVKKAEEEIEQRKQSSLPPYYHVWLVFDRDSFPSDDFDNAISSSTRKAIIGSGGELIQPHWHAAWSNEAFELWYLLHFQDVMGGGIQRTHYQEILGNYLTHKYKKNSPSMFHELLPHLQEAIARARRPYERWEKESPFVPFHERNPATFVYQLVEDLIRYM